MPERVYSDAAHRCSDIVTMAAIAGDTGKWLAIRMSDGGYDGVIYDHRRDAVRHQLSENWCCYVQVQPGGMTPKEADAFISYCRALYDAGFRLPDPEFQPPLMPLLAKDQKRQIAALTKRGRR